MESCQFKVRSRVKLYFLSYTMIFPVMYVGNKSLYEFEAIHFKEKLT
jgi:hypothetical protein